LEAVADHLLLFDLQEAAEAVARLEEALGAQGAGEK
jgi:hypothetical protein